MARALIEAGFIPDVISAVSVGALNGAVLAQDPSVQGVERLEGIWRSADARDLFPGNHLQKAVAALRRRDHICDNAGLQRLIDDNVRVEVFEDLKVPFHVTVAEMMTGTLRVYRTGRLRPVLLATTALPGIFSPVEINGVLMVDGGIGSNIPTGPAVAARSQRLFVLDVSRPMEHKVPTTPLGMMIHSLNMTRYLGARRDLETALDVGAILLPRPESPDISFDDTSHSQDLMQSAYDRAARFLADEFSDVA
jgi:NTE family protein